MITIVDYIFFSLVNKTFLTIFIPFCCIKYQPEQNKLECLSKHLNTYYELYLFKIIETKGTSYSDRRAWNHSNFRTSEEFLIYVKTLTEIQIKLYRSTLLFTVPIKFAIGSRNWWNFNIGEGLFLWKIQLSLRAIVLGFRL